MHVNSQPKHDLVTFSHIFAIVFIKLTRNCFTLIVLLLACTDFRKAGLEILKYEPTAESLASDSPVKQIRQEDFSHIEELCLVVAPKIDVPKRFKSYKFDPEDYIALSNRVPKLTLKHEVDSILKCHNLKVLGIHGVGDKFEGQVMESLIEQLPVSCPLIEHMILDDSDIILAKTYVEKVSQERSQNHLKCLEVKNSDFSEDLAFIIENSPNLEKVVITDLCEELLDILVPKVTSLTVSWITPSLFDHLTSISKTSSIRELCIKNVDFDVKASMIEALAESMTQLTSLEISSNLENIVHLAKFPSLTEVIWDADPIKVALDPYFPVDLKYALEQANIEPLELEEQLKSQSDVDDLNGEEPQILDQNVPPQEQLGIQDNGAEVSVVIPTEEDTVGEANQKHQNVKAFNTFLEECGQRLTKFSLSLRNKYNKEMFTNLKKYCPRLKNLAVTTLVEDQFFEIKHFSISSLESLSLTGVIMTNIKLLDLLEHCTQLQYLEIELAKRLTINSIGLIQSYAEHFAKKLQQQSLATNGKESSQNIATEVVSQSKHESSRVLTSSRRRFVAKISTEGKEDTHIKQARDYLLLDYLQKKPATMTSKLRQHY